MSTNLHQFVHLVNCSASSKPVQDYSQAYTYIAALTRQPPETAIIDVRLIHDTDKSVPAIKRRGTLPQLWAEIIDWQNRGYGCFVNVSEMDGIGNDLSNVAAVRAHLADLDGIDAQAQLQNAAAWTPAPTFGVSTSPGKAHVYWVVQPYQSNEYFTALQRRIRQAFNGDPSVIDASRVARMPGTLHLKNPQQPYLVNCFSLGGYGQSLNVETLAASLQHVNVIEGHHGRKELGDTTLQAPSLEWLSFAMSYVDPNTLDRGDWLSITAAFKQAGWNHADEQTLFNMWSQWCAQYNGNDPAENLKNWNSIRNSEIGWKSFRRRVPVLKAYEDFGYKEPPKPQPQPVPGSQSSPEYLDGISADHVKSTTAGAMKKMQELGIPLAFDEFTKTAFLEMPVPWDKTGVFPRPWTDNDITGLKTLLESHYLKPSKETVNDAATFIAKRNSYHPIRDYLNSLIWDGCPRCD